jgi:hypothetical protein
MTSTPSSAKDWTAIGRDLASSSSAEEIELANSLIDHLFKGMREGKMNLWSLVMG